MVVSSDQETLRKMIYGYRISQCLYAATSLGILEALKDGPLECRVLADQVHCDPTALLRLLRILAGLDFLEQTERGAFQLNQLSRPLLRDHTDSMRQELLYMMHPTFWMTWGQLHYSIKTNRPAFPETFGEKSWKYRAKHPELNALFTDMATTKSRQEADAILNVFDMGDASLIVDVGGGEGGFLAEILKRRTSMRGVLFDQPHVVNEATSLLDDSGTGNRCSIEAGDFFQKVPKNGDIYFVKAVLHNWNNDNATDILKTCRKAMSSHARLVVIESVLDTIPSPLDDLSDLHMLMFHGGRERTVEEFSALLESAGFKLNSIQATGANISIIEGKPI